MSSGKWNTLVLSFTAICLGVISFLTIWIDPFFHFHAPIAGLEYPLKEERYQNDGIARHFEYSAIITGSSTSQNFMTSQFKTLWGVEAIKQPYAGGTFFEIGNGLRNAFTYNQEIAYVLWGLDPTRIIADPNLRAYEGIPDYLYDRNPWNDIFYVLNKDVLPMTIAVVNYTRAGNVTTKMDDYGAWYPYAVYGREEVLKGLIDYSGFTQETVLTDTDKRLVEENIGQNILEIAKEHPKTQFYLYYSPASAAYWYGMVMTKQLHAQLEAEKRCTKLLLTADNIRLFAFADRIDVTTDLNLYMDTLHFSETVSEEILRWIHDGEGELTKDNYEEYYLRVEEIYRDMEYDYQ